MIVLIEFCPTGKHRTQGRTLSIAFNENNSLYIEFGNGVCVASLRPKEEGRIAIVTNAGRDVVDVGGVGAKVSQGGKP